MQAKMNDRVNVNLGNVQKTLLMPLWGRAIESGKSNPMLYDEAAVRIIDRVNYDFSPMARNLDPLTLIAWIRRNQICDRTVRKFSASCPDATIVNIGCGLDTTFERVDNGRLHWYDLDLPDVIALRGNFITPTERRKFLPASFLEESWMNQVVVHENILFLAAGVFYYFSEQDIRAFLIQLTDRYPGSELLFDVCSPFGLKVANKKVVESSDLDKGSYLTWGLKDKSDLLAWDSRIRLIGRYSYFRTYKIGIRNLMLGLLSDFLGIQYMLHLQLGVRK